MNKKQRKQRRLKSRRKQKELRKRNQEAKKKAQESAERAPLPIARKAANLTVIEEPLEWVVPPPFAHSPTTDTTDGPVLYAPVEMIGMIRFAEMQEPERLKKVFLELGRPFDDANLPAIAESVKNTFNTYKYPLFKDGRIYYGMPEPDVNLPLAGSVLLKLEGMKMGSIIWGKDLIDKKKLVRNLSRQYEFQLNHESPDFGICFLYVKGPENHFKNEALSTLPLVHNGQSQKIPLIYSVLSQMTDKELWVIWYDLD